MAKNFFEQLLDLTGSIFSGPKVEDQGDISSTESSGLSGVARYLEKLEEAATKLTGVEKYLLKLEEASAAAKAAQTSAVQPLSRVEQYLQQQAATAKSAPSSKPAAVPVSGVEKYLAKQSATASEKSPTPAVTATTHADEPPAKQSPAVEEKPAGSASVSRVDKYLASRQGTAAPAGEVAPKRAAAKKAAPAVKETRADTSEEKTVAAKKTESAAQPSDIINLAENATQCQAKTAKGPQCKNINGLMRIQRTINNKKYEFAVCSLHDNAAFKPFPALMK
jgi:hypothetical protein